MMRPVSITQVLKGTAPESAEHALFSAQAYQSVLNAARSKLESHQVACKVSAGDTLGIPAHVQVNAVYLPPPKLRSLLDRISTLELVVGVLDNWYLVLREG